MQLKKSTEQAVYVLVLLSMEDKPVKSSALSEKLQVSDSYLKKILRKFVNSGIVKSDANKNGGFSLNRPINQISFHDIYQAVEGDEPLFELTNMAEQIFPSKKQVENSRKIFINFIGEVQTEVEDKLKSFTLDQLIGNDNND